MTHETTPQRFEDRNLAGARFERSTLAEGVMRGVDVAGLQIDSPWLLEGGNSLWVNGIDVVPFVDAELDRRFPGRSQRHASDVAGLRAAWSVAHQAWAAAIARVRAMPTGTPDRSVDGEWSFAQTLRHMVMAIDTWLCGAVLGVEQPYHPIGQPNYEFAVEGGDVTLFWATSPDAPQPPAFDDVLTVFGDRVRMVSIYLAGASDSVLGDRRKNPWSPDYPETVLSCLHTILDESWEHLRYALRDLDALGSDGDGDGDVDAAADADADGAAGDDAGLGRSDPSQA